MILNQGAYTQGGENQSILHIAHLSCHASSLQFELQQTEQTNDTSDSPMKSHRDVSKYRITLDLRF